MRSLCLLLAFVAVAIASSGCGQLYTAKGYARGTTNTFTLSNWQSGQPTRTYLVHLPPDYSRYTDGGHPLVFSFHGYKGSSSRQESITGLSGDGLTINNRSFVVVYPQGTTGTTGFAAWNGAPYSSSNDDVAFFLKMYSVLTGDLCIDEQRVYASGKSNGGGFTNYLACTQEAASKLAAVATVSAAIYTNYAFGKGNSCNPGRGFPIIDFHGTADDVISYNGGNGELGAAYVSSSDFFGGWGSRDTCTNPNQATIATGVTVRKWSSCKNTALVRHFKIEGMDHAWPRTTLPSVCNGQAGDNDCDTTVINANDHILPFFTSFPLSKTLY
ncbi:poly(3-hydroxybutyrate) depolymerase [Planoprotostelium fungivorum]|uniref:Poly(3-hydroxybutyrate) depolymerase n=1 Tax=Planoprotostelium fungivorum TaxID=1890364 RepID=A0A2P6NCG1_9EUKA|nr:poly(3-hydroxybutyrate) depolymerase [Planoprotostelium fungivorum]